MIWKRLNLSLWIPWLPAPQWIFVSSVRQNRVERGGHWICRGKGKTQSTPLEEYHDTTKEASTEIVKWHLHLTPSKDQSSTYFNTKVVYTTK